MATEPRLWVVTRREWLHLMGALGGGALLGAGCSSPAPEEAVETLETAPPVDEALTAQRAAMGAAPIEMSPLGANLTMLSGPGGNVLVLNGADGKVVVDTFVLPAWGALEMALDGIGTAPITTLINTHWHFDHTDNNASFREAGARIVAHANTATRMSESHDLLGMHFEPSPSGARPTETFTATRTLEVNGETIELAHIPPAHTDTDISVLYTKANVLHAGDVFFNGIYPFIDAGTGGTINGMIAGAERLLTLAGNATRIVPGHGPLADKAALTRYRDMLATSRDKVQKLKSAGGTLEEVQAARPTADLDATWGMGFMMPNDFVALVYSTL
jgi:glyoxylase-like metal-dependent hydrolase (beta-lactamase superfamily II)